MVKIINPDTNEEWEYFLDTKLIPYLNDVKKNIDKKDRDYVVLVDGYEGSGKSTFAIQMGRYLDNTLNLNKICMTADEFKQAIINAKKGDCIIYDEAVTGLSSGESITRIGRLLKSMMMQMRQKNLFVIIVIPSFFELNRYAVLGRAKGLFHIYERNGLRGYFVGYNKSDMKKVYLNGRKHYSYCWRSFFNGRFYGKYAVDEEQYKKKKEEALFNTDSDEGGIGYLEKRWIKARDLLTRMLIEKGVKQIEIVEFFGRYGVKIHQQNVSMWGGKGSNLMEIKDLSSDTKNIKL